MSDSSIYRDIAERTGGNVYLGIVGPVRTGKSTFIKKFMEALVLPNISEGARRDRARDELPQSAAGKTVMTTEPKFIPDEAVEISPDGIAKLKVRLIDCVGYVIPEALGILEDGKTRLVRTPWSDSPVPFTEAAEEGTQKVIREHSTVGIVVTSDGSVGDIARSSYLEAEERVVNELKELGKPFAIVLNSSHPDSAESAELGHSLEEKYGVPVALVSCLNLDADDVCGILGMVLNEFPISEVRISLPEWTAALPPEHPIRASLLACVGECAAKATKIGELTAAFGALKNNEYVAELAVRSLELGQGSAEIAVAPPPELFYKTLGELSGFEVSGEKDLIPLLCDLAKIRKDHARISDALAQAEELGYGIVMPTVDELHLEEPQIVRHTAGYGVRLRASARSIHMIRANIETEISPVVGTEQQSEDLVNYLLREFEGSPSELWNSNIFGKSLYELVTEGLHSKLEHMPNDARAKLGETLERIINEGSGGLICILL